MKIEFIIEPDETGKGRIIVDERYYGLPVDAVKQINDAFQIKQNVQQLINILDIVEETDEGREFRPNYISSCRVLDANKLGMIMTQLKNLVEGKKES